VTSIPSLRPAAPPTPARVDAVLATPPGGVCLLTSLPGYGRRTLLARATGEDAAVVQLPARYVDDPEWRELARAALDRDLGEALAEPETWFVVLDLDPALHAAVLDDLEGRADGEAPGRVAVTTSADLDRRFPRARMAGRLVALDGDDLALDVAEAATLLHELAPDLDEGAAREVVALCDGWVGALVATARRHHGRGSAETLTWLRTRGADQLVGPWLDAQPEQVRDALLGTAILEQLHPRLVDAVVGPGSGRAIVTAASPGGAVRPALHPTTEDGPWFDRHPLLTATLLAQGAGRRDEVERHRRAADWFQQEGLVRGELVHRLSAGDAQAAATRFQRHEGELMETGHSQVVLSWYRTLPDIGQPEQLVREGWAYALSNRIVEARTTLERLRLALRDERRTPAQVLPEIPHLAAEADVIEAWIAEHEGDLVRARDRAHRAREEFAGAWSTNSHQIAALIEARASLHLGGVAAAEVILSAVREEPFLIASLGEGRRATTEAELAWVRGDVLRARSWGSRYARWLVGQDSGSSGVRGGGSVGGLLAEAEAGRFEEAVRGLESAVEHAVAVNEHVTDEVLARLALAQLLGTSGDLRRAFEQVGRARESVHARSPDGGLLLCVVATEVRLRLLAGDTVRAERLLRLLPASTGRQLLALRLALHRASTSALAQTRDISPTTPREQAQLSVLTAWALFGTSRHRAEVELLRAADVCAEHGMTTVLVGVPSGLLELARRTASHHVHDPLLQMVVAAERRRATGTSRNGSGAEGAGRGDLALTRGELQLLELLPTRSGNARIADDLGVSVNTVKTRLRRLYAKLGVHDRDEAIARARELGLLQPVG
jgi:LuxR family maltose regulon positive regulatory protein